MIFLVSFLFYYFLKRFIDLKDSATEREAETRGEERRKKKLKEFVAWGLMEICTEGLNSRNRQTNLTVSHYITIKHVQLCANQKKINK